MKSKPKYNSHLICVDVQRESENRCDSDHLEEKTIHQKRTTTKSHTKIINENGIGEMKHKERDGNGEESREW